MGFMDRVKDFVAPTEDEDDEEEYVEEIKTTTKKKVYEEPKQQGRYEQKAQNTMSALSDKTKMVLFEPRSYAEAQEAGIRLKEGRAVVVNLHKLDHEYAQRTIDFLTGVVFALDGNIQQIGQNVILCYPAEIGVAGVINLGKQEEVVEEIDEYIS